jgi:hypothetical protein
MYFKKLTKVVAIINIFLATVFAIWALNLSWNKVVDKELWPVLFVISSILWGSSWIIFAINEKK